MAFFLERSKNVVLKSFLVLRMLFDCGDSPLEMLLLCAQWTNQLSLEKTTSGILLEKRNANSEPTGRSTPSMNRNDRHCWIMASSFLTDKMLPPCQSPVATRRDSAFNTTQIPVSSTVSFDRFEQSKVEFRC